MKSKGVYCGYQVASQTHKANVQNNTKLQTQGWVIVQFHNQKKTHPCVVWTCMDMMTVMNTRIAKGP